MLLLNDDDELPESPERAEAVLTSQLGPDALNAIDAAILGHSGPRWLKVARIVHGAIATGAFAINDATVDLHVRRVVALVAAGTLEAQGNLRKPRWSEVRLPLRPSRL